MFYILDLDMLKNFELESYDALSWLSILNWDRRKQCI